MKITPQMDLDQLAERMGKGADRAEACHMRHLLVWDYVGRDTEDIPAAIWDFFLVDVAQGSAYLHGSEPRRPIDIQLHRMKKGVKLNG